VIGHSGIRSATKRDREVSTGCSDRPRFGTPTSAKLPKRSIDRECLLLDFPEAFPAMFVVIELGTT
jgi:hypothetical protein